jgi:hypothetical protein
MGEGFVWASQGAGLIHDIPSVAELFDRMLEELTLASLALNRSLGVHRSGNSKGD